MKTTLRTDATLRQLERQTRISKWVLKGLLVLTLAGLSLAAGLAGQTTISLSLSVVASMVAMS